MSPKWSSSSLLIAVSTAFFLIPAVLAKCECGYSVKGQGTYTDALETDFLHQDDIANDENWDVSRYLNKDKKPYNMQYKLDNVISNPLTKSSGDPGLQLYVRGPTKEGAPVSTAELVTKRVDMHYGSYRAAIKYTQQSGTCGSMFWYKNESQEIDVELLSFQDTDSKPDGEVHFVLHAEGPSDNRHLAPHVPFHPSDGFHEYRFDWSPGRVAFYTDGKYMGDLTDGVPSVPGRIILNHWSDGNLGWTRGPPEKDALMTVAYVKAYFNTTETATKCVDPEADGAVCEVPDQSGPVSPDQPTTFLITDASNTPANKTVDAPAHNPTSTNLPDDDPSKITILKISPDNKCGAVTDTVVLLSRIAGKAANQHLANAVLVLPASLLGIVEPVTTFYDPSGL
ncbi:MAG: hypothetical protein Q9166_004511 [cf. Caloplaca sp. 2 TL-2023]